MPQGQVIGCIAIDEDTVVPSSSPQIGTTEPPGSYHSSHGTTSGEALPTPPLASAAVANGAALVSIELKRLAVHPTYRRRGLGKQLVETALNYVRAAAQSRGTAAAASKAAVPGFKVRLTCLSGAVVPEAAAACALYSGLGFEMMREYASGPSGPSKDDEKRAIMCDFELPIDLSL